MVAGTRGCGAVRCPVGIDGGIRPEDRGRADGAAAGALGVPPGKRIAGPDRVAVRQERQPPARLCHQYRAAIAAVGVEGDDEGPRRCRAASLEPVGVDPGIPVEVVVPGQPGTAGRTGVPAAENIIGAGALRGVRPLPQPAAQAGISGLGNRTGAILVPGEADDVAVLRHPMGIEGLVLVEGIPRPHCGAGAAGPLTPAHEDIPVPGGVGGPAGELSPVVRRQRDRGAAAAVGVKGDVIGRGCAGGKAAPDISVLGENMVLGAFLTVGEPAHKRSGSVRDFQARPVVQHAAGVGEPVRHEVLGIPIVPKFDDIGALRRPQGVEGGVLRQLVADVQTVSHVVRIGIPAPEYISSFGRLRRKGGDPSAGVRGHRDHGAGAAVGVKGDLIRDYGTEEIFIPLLFQLIAVPGNPHRRIPPCKIPVHCAVKVKPSQTAKAALLIQDDLPPGGQLYRGAAQGTRASASGGNLLRFLTGGYIQMSAPQQEPHAVFHQNSAAAEIHVPFPGQVDAAGELGGPLDQGAASHGNAGDALRLLRPAQNHRLAPAAEEHAAVHCDPGPSGGQNGGPGGLHTAALNRHRGFDAVHILPIRLGTGDRDGGAVGAAAPDRAALEREGAAMLHVDHIARAAAADAAAAVVADAVVRGDRGGGGLRAVLHREGAHNRDGRVGAGGNPMPFQIQQDIARVLDGQGIAAQINVAGQLDLGEAGTDPVLDQLSQGVIVPRLRLRELAALVMDHRKAVGLHIGVAFDLLPVRLRPGVIDILHGIQVQRTGAKVFHAGGNPNGRQVLTVFKGAAVDVGDALRKEDPVKPGTAGKSPVVNIPSHTADGRKRGKPGTVGKGAFPNISQRAGHTDLRESFQPGKRRFADGVQISADLHRGQCVAV